MIRSKKIITICGLAVLASLMLGCSSASSPPASLELTCDDFAQTPDITRQIQVNAGDSFTLTMCSNPTTGYEWESAVIGDVSVLSETDHQFLGPENDSSQLAGAPGKDVWTFKTLKKGSTTISIAYSRPWEGGEKGTWNFNATVTVK